MKLICQRYVIVAFAILAALFCSPKARADAPAPPAPPFTVSFSVSFTPTSIYAGQEADGSASTPSVGANTPAASELLSPTVAYAFSIHEGTVPLPLGTPPPPPVVPAPPPPTGPPPTFSINTDGSGLKVTADQKTGAQSWPFYVECDASWTDPAGNSEAATGYVQETIDVASVKWWDVGYPIGTDLQFTPGPNGTTIITTTQDGQMKAPQDQTVNPSVPATLYAMPNQVLNCMVTPATDWDHYAMTGVNYPNDGGYVADTVSYVWSCKPVAGTFSWTDGNGKLQTGSTAPVAAASWTAPTAAGDYVLTCTIDDGAPAVDYGTRDDPAIGASVTVTVPNFSMETRRHGSMTAIPDPNNPGSTILVPAPYGSLANVAAGAIQDSNHQADLLVTATDQKGNPLAGVPVAPPVVTVGDYYATQGVATLNSGVTGSDGTVSGAYQSSDEETTVTLTLNTIGPSVSIDQHWNENPASWQMAAFFDYDTPNSIAFVPTFTDGSQIPITGHTVEFDATFVDTWVWDPDADGGAGGYDEIQYTTDPSLADPGAQVPVIYQPDLSGLAALSPSTAGDSGSGTYSTALSVPFNGLCVVDLVDIGLKDGNVYSLKGN